MMLSPAAQGPCLAPSVCGGGKEEEYSEEGEEEFFEKDAAKAAIVSDARKADQKRVDASILKVVDATPLMKNYLGSKFSLGKYDKPHKMIF